MRMFLLTMALLILTAPSQTAFAYACNQNYYTNSSGHHVHSPSCGAKGEGTPHAVCRDGSISYSEHHRGTCSHHGGVEHWD
jgi:hypothetical protein